MPIAFEPEVFLNLDFDVLSGLIEQSLPGFGILFFTGQRRHLGMIQHDGTEAGLFRQGFETILLTANRRSSRSCSWNRDC